MSTMIRKQIYIGRHHEQILKRLAREKNVSEAELVREAIDRQAESPVSAPAMLDPLAWSEALRFMNGLARHRGVKAKRVRREDAYGDRLGRWR
jgi:hypothetical protein